MKKLVLSFFYIVVLITIISCSKNQKEIDISDVKANYSIYSLLPESIKNNIVNNSVEEINVNTFINHSEIYKKLLMSYYYVDELFIVFNKVMENAIDLEKVVVQERYKYKEYEFYALNYQNDFLTIEILNASTSRKLTVNVETLENSDKKYTGSHEINDDIFTYEIVNDKHMQINYKNSSINAFADIVKEDNFVKTHIRYRKGISRYQIYSIAGDDYVAIYYEFKDSINDKSFEVFDKFGNLVYQSFSLDDGIYEATGWHMQSLNVENIDKIKDNTYLINGIKFENKPGEVNFYHINCKYIDKDYYLFGQLSFNENIANIISVRKPLETDKFEIVLDYALKTQEFYVQVNDK